MATSIPPTTEPERPPTAAGVPGPDALDFLDDEHAVFQAHRDAWTREERRLEGGDGVLTELAQFAGEPDASYRDRQNTATYVNFARAHVAAVTGTLSLHRPTPGAGLSYGTLGEVRTRDKIDTPTFGEILHYNVDGVGADGSEMPAWFDAVDERAQATGHRWLMLEAPALADIRARRRAAGERGVPADVVSPTLADVLAGFRPYAVEFSPLAVPNWHVESGQLDFAVVKVAIGKPRVEDGHFVDPAARKGYYLLARGGFDGLGAWAQGGGWWQFDADKRFVRGGTWQRTRGQIPMWMHCGDTSPGTTERPAVSRSSTMMLGQIGVSLMNSISARDYDFFDACASRLFFLGADGAVMTSVAEQAAAAGIYIGVPTVPIADGANGTRETLVQVYDGSTGVVVAEVSKAIVEAKFQEARQEMFQQLTSAPESSGASKQAGFSENKAPVLARRAKLRQQSEQTFLHFAELRFGFERPTGYSVWPTEFDLAPLVDTITETLDRLRRSSLRSPTWEVELTKGAALEAGTWPEDPTVAAAVEAELKASAQAGAATALAAQNQAAADRALLLGGGDDATPSEGATGDAGGGGTDAGSTQGQGGGTTTTGAA